MSDKEVESLDLGAMMDDSLDAIPDAPDYVKPPPGTYRLCVKEAKQEEYTTKDDPNTKLQRLKILYEVLATVSLASAKEPPVADGSLFSENFTATKDGLSYFKTRIKKVLNVTDTSGITLREMMSSVLGAQFDAVLSIRESVKGDTKYENVQIRVVPPSAS